MIDLSYDTKIWAKVFFRFVTMHAFDRLTDGRTDRQSDGHFAHGYIAVA